MSFLSFDNFFDDDQLTNGTNFDNRKRKTSIFIVEIFKLHFYRFYERF
jgi:hypothetical protein